MTSSSVVDLLDLAASALSSTVVASATIRDFCKPTEADDGAQDTKNTRLKDDGSFVTDADIAAQHVIVSALRSISPDIRIVGEESAETSIDQDSTNALSEIVFPLAQQEIRIRHSGANEPPPLAQEDFRVSDETKPTAGTSPPNEGETATKSSPSSSLFPEPEDCKVDPSRVSVFIDPLDGTKAYARGDYDPVSILIAIILDQRPCFGVICKPFGYEGQTSVLDTGCVAFYGGTLLGGVFVAGGNACSIPTSENGGTDNLPRAVISSSRSKGVVQDFVTHLGSKGMIHPEPMHISGAGEKSLRIVLREKNEGLWFFPKGGTSLWDVAASDALLRAIGGKLTDKFGQELDYNKSRDEAENEDGVIACYDDKLHAECIRLFKEGNWKQQLPEG